MKNNTLKHSADILQMFYFTCNHGLTVSPSGRLPSVLVRPHGSLVTGTPPAVRDRAIASFIA